MGVPSFYRWLAKKYPKIVIDAKEDAPVTLASGESMGVDISGPNASGVEVDNLYLDMNGIIHPCCHPEDDNSVISEEVMIERIFRYIDRIMMIVHPRQLLYMAIDGVAPRAKMNQQRSRRFRAAKEACDAEKVEDELREEWRKAGKTLPPKKSRPWDSNVITPGTPFMAKLSEALHYYIADRITCHKGWDKLKIIFSDAKVPGEGEHKIMKFIRLQRAQPGYNANTRHMLYGMDADLIMLGLASHDPYFYIIREEVVEKRPVQRCFICGAEGHTQDECTGEAITEAPKQDADSHQKPFQFLSLAVLREYLQHELYVDNLPFAFDLERAIDDFVFMCFFVGNDFLPHLPSLEIREGAIERLLGLYKRLLPSLGGYISENGKLNMSRVDVLLSELGMVEDGIFRQRKKNEEFQKVREQNRLARRNARMVEREGAQRHAEEAGLAKLGGTIHQPDSIGRISYQHQQQQPFITAKKRKLAEADDEDAKQRLALQQVQLKSEPIVEPPAKLLKSEVGEDAAHKATLAMQAAAQAKREDGEDEGPVATALMRESVHVVKHEVAIKSEQIQADGVLTVIQQVKVEEMKESSAALPSPAESGAGENESEAIPDVASLPTASLDLGGEDDIEDDVVVVDTPLKHRLEKELEGGSKAPAASTVDADASIDFNRLLNDKLKSLSQPPPGEDAVRFGEEGWKERYYYTKVQINKQKKEDLVVFHKLFKSYAEGLAWVMLYYYSGCASWSWYYPFHYAPMASDLTNLDRYKLEFDLSTPFTPIAQLMGVLPAQSAHALPPPCRELMSNPDSPIIDFYPNDFPMDLNGKKYLWQAVALLPWIDEKRLLSELNKVETQFTAEERERNTTGYEYLYVHADHPLAASMKAMYAKHGAKIRHKTAKECATVKVTIDTQASEGMCGAMSPYNRKVEIGGDLPSNIGLPTLTNVQCVSVMLHDAPYRPHLSRLLDTLTPPPAQLSEEDLMSSGRRGPRFGSAPSHFQTAANAQAHYAAADNKFASYSNSQSYIASSHQRNYIQSQMFSSTSHSYTAQTSYPAHAPYPHGTSQMYPPNHTSPHSAPQSTMSAPYSHAPANTRSAYPAAHTAPHHSQVQPSSQPYSFNAGHLHPSRASSLSGYRSPATSGGHHPPVNPLAHLPPPGFSHSPAAAPSGLFRSSYAPAPTTSIFSSATNNQQQPRHTNAPYTHQRNAPPMRTSNSSFTHAHPSSSPSSSHPSHSTSTSPAQPLNPHSNPYAMLGQQQQQQQQPRGR